MRGFVAVAMLLLAAAGTSQAQCVNLAVPGLNGCGNFAPSGIPTIACSGSPTSGNAAFAINANVPCQTSPPILLVGTRLPNAITIRGPFGSGGFCGPTQAPCLLFVGPTIYAAVPATSSSGPQSYTFALPIPNDAWLQGVSVCVQSVNLCSILGGACVGASQGMSIRVL